MQNSKSIGIGLATILAAIITGIFGFFAAKQVLRVEVAMPTTGKETFSIKAASNKIEELSRKLALAEQQIASLQQRASGEAASEDRGLLKRIESLEEELESKNLLIEDLHQAQQHSSDNGSPLVGADAKQSGDDPKGVFHTRWFQIRVISIEATAEEIILLAEFQAVKDEAVNFHLRTNHTFVLDHQGNRWGGITKVQDTLGVVTAPANKLLPGTTVRSRMRFEADVSRSASLPNPKPPFTLIAEETYSQQQIVIEGLEPQ